MRALLFLTLILTGCASRRAPVPEPAVQPVGPSFIDLEAGWRLRVVTPILKSGGYRLAATAETTAGNAVSLSVGDNFQGYEVTYYKVRARNGVQFISGEVTRDGQTTPVVQPIAHLFELPRGVRHMRLLYLVRASQADHDMAFAGARETQALEALTRRVEMAPAECHDGQHAFCSWIPAGIAVVPERRSSEGWVPVR